MNDVTSLSDNSVQSLTEKQSFVKYLEPLEGLENLPEADLKFIHNEIHQALADVKNQKKRFLFTTKAKIWSPSYKAAMLKFESKAAALKDNLYKVNLQLDVLKSERLEKDRARQDAEKRYLYHFWKSARDKGDFAEFKRISEIASNFCPFPESLLR